QPRRVEAELLGELHLLERFAVDLLVREAAAHRYLHAPRADADLHPDPPPVSWFRTMIPQRRRPHRRARCETPFERERAGRARRARRPSRRPQGSEGRAEPRYARGSASAARAAAPA